MATPTDSVQCFGRKKTAVAVTHCKRGRRLININGVPIELLQHEILRFKAFELSSSSVTTASPAWTCAFVSRAVVTHPRSTFSVNRSPRLLSLSTRSMLMSNRRGRLRTLLVADPRRCEPKKFCGLGERSLCSLSTRLRNLLDVQ
ncbi:hypothetical protein CASFOL_028772 [Castilleja foliolosa]|uniref:Ribosomal protein S16 n=1 Tax=Castilleja foliolosa TaxID=1961234 RepID=A0ABD3CDP2_9LAMI